MAVNPSKTSPEDTMRDVADDIVASRPTLVATADATDLTEAIALLNEMKAVSNVMANAAIKTTKA